MRTELEQSDVENIAGRVVELLKPLLSNKGKNEDKDTIFDVESLAEYLRVSKKWIYERTHLKEIPFIKVGGQLRFRKRAIDKWLDSFKVPAVGTPAKILRVA